jgi:hypothetical protein
MTSLPMAPSLPVDAHGAPVLGTFAGHVGRVSWDTLAGSLAARLTRRLKLKRWHYVAIADARCVCAFAIVDLGWSATAFGYVFDRARRRLLWDRSFMGLPGISAQVAERAGVGACSTYHGAGVALRLERPDGASRWHVHAEAPGVTLAATLDAAAAPATLCAIAVPEGGVANCTHKTVCLPATGTLTVGEACCDFTEGFGLLDHTTGVLGRDTKWRWACATGPRFGLNLVEGFNGPAENAVWIDGDLLAVGPATITYDPAAPEAPWTVRTTNGDVALTFTPEGLRREDKNLLVAASHFLQPIGTFAGTIRGRNGRAVEIRDLVGVTEDHASRW